MNRAASVLARWWRRLDAPIRVCMLSPGSPEAIRYLIAFRYGVHGVSALFVLWVFLVWPWFAEESGASMVLINGASLASTVLLDVLARRRSRLLLPGAIAVALQDLAIVLGAIMSSGLLASPILYMPLLVLMVQAIVLGTRPAAALCACYVAAFPAAVWVVIAGHWPWTTGAAWQTVGGLDQLDLGLFNVTLQLGYFLGTYGVFLLVADRLRVQYRSFNDRLEEARQQFVRATEERQAEAHLVEMGRLASFLAHELRNPLTVILSGAEVCERRPDDVDLVREWAGDSVEQVSRMRRMLGEVLGYSRDYDPEPRAFDLDVLVDEQLDPRGELAAMEVEVTWRRQEGRRVFADRGHTLQILHNLIRNAIQAAGPDGRVWVHTAPAARDDTVVIEVHDDGPGIPAEERGDVFRPFVSSKGEGGTGLGLAVCRRLADKNGFDLTVGDSPLGGARFRLAIPAADPHVGVQPGAGGRAPDGPPALPLQPGETVLVVDDEEPIRRALGQLLHSLGVESHTAASLAEARAALERSPPRLVLLDLLLGDEKGADLLPDIDCLEPRPTVVVVSALADQETMTELRKRGVDAYLLKPVSSADLRRVLEEQLAADDDRQREVRLDAS